MYLKIWPANLLHNSNPVIRFLNCFVLNYMLISKNKSVKRWAQSPSNHRLPSTMKLISRNIIIWPYIFWCDFLFSIYLAWEFQKSGSTNRYLCQPITEHFCGFALKNGSAPNRIDKNEWNNNRCQSDRLYCVDGSMRMLFFSLCIVICATIANRFDNV